MHLLLLWVLLARVLLIIPLEISQAKLLLLMLDLIQCLW